MLTIREPFWKKNAFGISEYEIIHNDTILVECSYSTLDGTRPYPHKYMMSSKKAAGYETMMVKGVKLHIIPINEFEVVYNA